MQNQAVGTSVVQQQLAAARTETEARIRAGRLGSVDDLRTRFPAVWDSPETALELVYTEYILRRANGESPDQTDWLNRYPQWADRLDRLFGLYDLMAGGDTHGDKQNGTVPGTGKRQAATPAEHPDGYEVLGEIGRGGMAVVYQARQLELNRVVALKVLRWGEWEGADGVRRVRREAELVARLQHPNIVQVIEVGEWDGFPFLALEYVSGGTLADALARLQRQGKTGVRTAEAVALVELLARATQYAHEQGVVHRDLKPANVLLADDPAGPFARPKITDFGLAVSTELSAAVSQSAMLAGTPCYMAPEQATARRDAVGPRTDVYALGGILYELLTGRPPFQGATVLETLDLVRQAEPVPPRQLRPKLSRDLDTVCLKCLSKDPTRRYDSAVALADDLARFRDGRPIAARPVGVTERAWKWCRRRPLVAGMLCGLLAAVLAAVVLPSVFWKRAEDGRVRETRLRQAAEEREARLLLKTARLQWFDHNLDGARESLAACDDAHRDAEWKYLWRACRPPHLELQALGSMDERSSITTALTFTPDGTAVYAAFREKELRSWDAATGRQLISFNSPRVIKGIAALSSNETLITYHWFTPGQMGKPTINLAAFDPASNALRLVWTAQQKPTPLAVSPDGGTAAYRPLPRSLVVFDVQTGGQLWQLNGVWFNDTGMPEISGDGRRIVARMEEWKEEVFELRTGKLVGTIHIPKSVGASLPSLLAVNRDASRAAFCFIRSGRAHDLIIRDAGAHDSEAIVRTPFLFVPQVQFSPDGRLIAASGQGAGYVGVWDAQTGAEVILLRGHRDRVQCFAFSPDSKRLVIGDASGRVAIWDVTPD